MSLYICDIIPWRENVEKVWRKILHAGVNGVGSCISAVSVKTKE
jgi:hypothetical protein